MEPFHQHTSETDKIQGEPGSDETAMADPVFYEFAAEAPEQSDAHVPEREASATSKPVEEVQPGVTYPPPPSYYEHMQLPEKEPLLVAAPSNREPARIAPAISPMVAPPQQAFRPARRSRKGLWITLSIIGAFVLLSCGLCAWASYSMFGNVFQDTRTVTNLASNYYQNIQDKDYNAAYAQVQVSNLSSSAFEQQAQQRETQLGSITSFALSAVAPDVSTTDTGSAFSSYTVTLTVSRGTSSYNVHLDIKQVGSAWKIVYFDVI